MLTIIIGDYRFLLFGFWVSYCLAGLPAGLAAYLAAYLAARLPGRAAWLPAWLRCLACLAASRAAWLPGIVFSDLADHCVTGPRDIIEHPLDCKLGE